MAATVGYVLLLFLPTTVWLVGGHGVAAGDPQLEGLPLVGHLALLVGYPALALQPVLAARFKWLDRLFGLDQVYSFHKAMAMTAGLLLLVYPFLMASGSAAWNTLVGAGLPWPDLLLRVAAVMTLVQVVVSTVPRVPGVDHERWRSVHNSLAVTILALLLPQFLGRHVDSLVLALCWIALGALGLGVWVYRKLIRPVSLRRNAYTIVEVRDEARGVWTIALAPPEGVSPLDFVPGQFQFLRPIPNGEEHPFTISGGEVDRTHASTIKESGDFTSGIRNLADGDRVAVEGPFGRFSYQFHPDEETLVFLAGGIGITPMMAMLRALRADRESRRVRLYYGNRREEDIVFRRELEEMEREGLPRLRTTHVLSRAGADWSGARGHIEWETIRPEVERADDRTGYYICGPPAMLDSLLPPLYRAGIPPKRVHFERFAL